MHYRKLERILYDYNVIKMNISNLEVELSQLALPSGVPGISYEEHISSGKISNMPESATISKMEKEELLRSEISYKKNLLMQIDNAMGCLNPKEKEIIEERYIKGSQWWEVAYAVRYSEAWCKSVRKIAINKMLATFKSYYPNS